MKDHHVGFFMSSIGAALAVVLIQSCGGGGWVDPPEHPIQPITVALPYVEAVHFPSEIHAWQPFTIEFELSCEQFPDALRSPARPFPGDDLAYEGNEREWYHFVGVVLLRDVTQINAAEPPHASVLFEIRGLSAGEHSVRFVSAQTRSEGGRQIQVDRLTWVWMGQDEWPFLHEVTFMVQP